MRALLLIAHGSRRAEANADLHHVAAEVASRTADFPIIVPSYLELCEPGIEAGGAICVERGATEVVMLPYFLSPGRHVMEDLTAAQSALATRFPHVPFRLAGHLGRHPKLIDIVVERAKDR
jgi:sirohydrochlorin ferrochelatase